QRTNAAVAIAMSMGWQQHRKGLRRFLALQAALSTAIGAVLAAWTQSFWPLFICVGLTAPTSGALWAIHRPMLIDGYVPHVRVRAVSAHQAFIVAGTAIAPAVVWFLVGPGPLEWRAALLVVGLLCGVAAVAGSLLLRSPVMGRP